MKTFKCLVTTVLVLSLFACQDNTEESGNNKYEKVYLNVSVSVPETRADLNPVDNGYVSAIGENSYIFVLDGLNSVIGDPVKFVAGETSNEMTFATTSEARSILFVANAISGFDPAQYGTRASLEKEILSMQDLAPDTNGGSDNLHGVKYAMMYNTFLPEINRDIAEEWTVAVTIAPIISRIEISGISADAPLTEQEIAAGYVGIKSYKLTGVAINNISKEMRLNGDLAGINQLSGNILRTVSDWSCDIFKDVTAAKEFTPQNEVWAYHLSPSEEIIPQIVFMLKDIVFEDDTTAEKLYITVKGYEDSNSNAITEFKAGNVYQIEKVSFNHTHLSTEVDPEQIQLTATVNVKAWVVNPLTPII